MQSTHACLHIQGALGQADLSGILSSDSGRNHSDAEVREILNQMRRRGFTYFVGSCCNRIGKDGSCQGHKFEEVDGEMLEYTIPTGISQDWEPAPKIVNPL